MKIRSAFKALAFAALPLAVAASPMLEPSRKSLAVAFINGDSLVVKCDQVGENCSVRVTVAGQSRSFGPRRLAGSEVLPWRAALYSGSGSGRAEYYSFEVSVVCPGGDAAGELAVCTANVLIRGQEPPEVSIVPYTGAST